jgi:hypothetical protein
MTQMLMTDRYALDAKKISTDILEWVSLDNSDNGMADVGADVGDSDDDSDGHHEDYDSLDSIQSNPTFFNIQRILRYLRSNTKNDRLISLVGIEMSIIFLSHNIDPLPPLTLPPPYDVSSVTMKCQSALVSDLSVGAWPHWEQTQVSLLSQFKTNELKPENGDVTEGQKKLQVIYDLFGGEICYRFHDDTEQVRVLAIRCIQRFCSARIRLNKYLHNLMREIISKYKAISHDETLNVFVYDETENNLFKRGGATLRQDRSRLLNVESLILMNEVSEEIRCDTCHLFSSVVQSFLIGNQLASLDPYYVDILLVVQSHLSDPFPELKIASACLLVQIIRISQWESVAKHFAIALARSALPNMRHRNAKVRVSAITLFEASIAIPDRSKFKGAGSEAIYDILGYREENVSFRCSV